MAEHKQSEKAVLNFLQIAEKYYGDWKTLMLRSFVSGVFTALGATVGFAVIIWVVSGILNQLGVLPVVGEFFRDLNNLLQSYRPLA